jgi:hypothetical protein
VEVDHLASKGWKTRQELAETFDVSLTHFDRAIRPLVAAKDVKREGRQVWLYGRAVLDAWLEHRIAGRAGPDIDPLLASGANSLALEEYRREKAKLARLDRLQRERELLSRDEVHAGLVRIAAVIRQAGESLQREYGPGAHAILDESLTEAEQAIREMFSDVDGDGQSGRSDPDGNGLANSSIAGSTIPHDEGVRGTGDRDTGRAIRGAAVQDSSATVRQAVV